MARAALWGRARALAVAALWIALFGAVGLGATLLLAAAVGWAGLPGEWEMAAGSTAAIVGFGLATWVVGHRLDRRSWAALGWGEPRRLAVRWGAGVGLGAAMAALAVGLAVIASGATVRADAATEAGTLVAPLAVGLVAAALFEELVFRGYPLRRLADVVGVVAATGLLGVGFAAAHLGNPNVTPLGTLNIGLAAVWLAAAFFSPGAMPLAWGLHFGWNAGLALGFEAPVSGLTFDLPLVEYEAGRHVWIDGGAFGPEGGVVATVVFSAGTAALIAARTRRTGGEGS